MPGSSLNLRHSSLPTPWQSADARRSKSTESSAGVGGCSGDFSWQEQPIREPRQPPAGTCLPTSLPSRDGTAPGLPWVPSPAFPRGCWGTENGAPEETPECREFLFYFVSSWFFKTLFFSLGRQLSKRKCWLLRQGQSPGACPQLPTRSPIPPRHPQGWVLVRSPPVFPMTKARLSLLSSFSTTRGQGTPYFDPK